LNYDVSLLPNTTQIYKRFQRVPHRAFVQPSITIHSLDSRPITIRADGAQMDIVTLFVWSYIVRGAHPLSRARMKVDIRTILCNRVTGAIVQDSGGITEEDKANLYAALGPFPKIGYAATCLNFRRNNEFWLPLAEHSTEVDPAEVRRYPQIVHWSGRICDNGARALASHSKLVSADISTSDNLTDSGVAAIFEGCPNLAKINVSGCWFVEDLRSFRGEGPQEPHDLEDRHPLRPFQCARACVSVPRAHRRGAHGPHRAPDRNT